MQKNLNVRFSDESKTPVVSKVLRIEFDTDDTSPLDNFISWVIETNRGLCNESGDIDCASAIAFIGCQKKALSLGLLPKLSLTEIRARSCAVSS